MAVLSGVRTDVKRIRTVATSPSPGWTRSYVRALLAVDMGAAAVAGLGVAQTRFADVVPAPATSPYVMLSLALPLLWAAVIAVAGGYERRFIGVGTEEFRRVLTAGATLTATVAITAYTSQTDVARGYVLVALPATTLLSLVLRYALRKRLHRMRTRGACMRRVVVVGHREAARELIRQFRSEPYHGMNVVGVCLPGSWDDSGVTDVDGCPVYGDFSIIPAVVGVVRADTVAVLSCPEMDGVELRRLAWELEKSGTDLTVAPALMEVAGPRTTIRPVAGLPLLHVEHPELAGVRRLVKGLFDRVAAACALVLLSPLFVVLALLIRMGGPGPALFRQTRVGKDGAEFTVYKFRTMVVGAEALKAVLRPRNEHDGVLFKMRKDPRVTPLGAWLRRYSLDELPQLFNVLLGHMSLVGPRPPLPEEVARYGHDVRRRLVVKPGMTGLWQVSGRSDLSWEESVRLDLRYVENWSLTLDVQILWKTCSAVIRGAGAY
ncbi:Undecaprenyl-phosphate galactose phosphotransferase, WbaP/exopolysaccharide biosynthesis polyprenyl glycosylphosphotransferase [Marinactinospora thermotolerans DSM 45154]|uniref:Undecaprenyl-phosphate galactose phosphotransferase, WbaP/exopolysaccharide biosynthesis polyprenyl glycosylphosphotransferase n=1 Tax=Marinactinospora thermotolerans DSM 45154 TaxID=1122192 RepID=A0A1T4SYV8_9ACTN|nr:sugar transferase [Marinactinospora thermotolerans]SKA33424.1 Undecaprenyl-phosphate galactose phosphotransferase, WbaP/exopolysaccharide biosynthesis polyprenyl glycosylphosphotransferase [Marinactinospora thermotolerans DSM 45154]